MIKNLYILRENGEFLYSKAFAEGAYIDRNVLLGFVMSAIHFSREIFQGIIRKIDLPIGQLVIYRDDYAKIIAASVASARDEIGLVERIMGEVVDEFIEKYQSKLDEINPENTRNFDVIAKKITQSKIKKRGILELLIGTIIGICVNIPLVMIGAAILTIPMMLAFEEISYFITAIQTIHGLNLESFIPLLFSVYSLQIIFVIVTVPASSFISGYFAGSKINGAIAACACVGSIPLISLLGIFLVGRAQVMLLVGFMMIIISIASLPLMIIFGIVFGFLGGMLKEKNALFPQEKI
ncbi:MAG: hypothetical protein ACXQS8_08525 [Candidatus Helarchaeales archaeon]